MAYHFRTDKIVAYEDWSEWVDQGFDYRRFLRYWFKKELPPFPPVLATPDAVIGVVAAYVSEGRWVADCPAKCGGALLVTPSDPWYLCVDCGAGWTRVVFPGARIAIEALLMKRSLIAGVPKSRNWLVGETVADLVAENLVHGLEA